MFDKINININTTKIQEEKNSKNIILDIFQNPHEIAFITFSIYFTGILYQIFKLVWIFNLKFKLWNLLFFSFSHSLSDFSILFWYSLIIFILTFFLVHIINLWLKKINFNNNKIIDILLLFCTFEIIIYSYDKTWLDFTNFLNFFIYFTPYLFSIILSWIIIYYNKLSRKIFYIFLTLFILYWFFILWIWSWKYYWCEKIRCNDAKKDCFLLEYKNDKYWFTLNWDIYKLDEFKSFFTKEYFDNKSYSWIICK